jgi:hypothetical protein
VASSYSLRRRGINLLRFPPTEGAQPALRLRRVLTVV